MDTLAIIKRIEIKLAESGLSKAEFYKRSGISSASFSQWNTGKFNPSTTKIRKAAEVLNVSFEYLYYGSEEKNPDELTLTEDEIRIIMELRKKPGGVENLAKLLGIE